MARRLFLGSADAAFLMLILMPMELRTVKIFAKQMLTRLHLEFVVAVWPMWTATAMAHMIVMTVAQAIQINKQQAYAAAATLMQTVMAMGRWIVLMSAPVILSNGLMEFVAVAFQIQIQIRMECQIVMTIAPDRLISAVQIKQLALASTIVLVKGRTRTSMALMTAEMFAHMIK
jgi:hypothetical protein